MSLSEALPTTAMILTHSLHLYYTCTIRAELRHWLPVPDRIEFKVLTFTHLVIQGFLQHLFKFTATKRRSRPQHSQKESFETIIECIGKPPR